MGTNTLLCAEVFCSCIVLVLEVHIGFKCSEIKYQQSIVAWYCDILWHRQLFTCSESQSCVFCFWTNPWICVIFMMQFGLFLFCSLWWFFIYCWIVLISYIVSRYNNSSPLDEWLESNHNPEFALVNRESNHNPEFALVNRESNHNPQFALVNRSPIITQSLPWLIGSPTITQSLPWLIGSQTITQSLPWLIGSATITQSLGYG